MGQAVSYILKGNSTSEKRSNKPNMQISPIIQWATSLRKAVSYILKSISGKRSNKQKLHTSPIIQWVKSHYCLHFVLFSMALLAIKSYSCSNSKTTRSDHISRLVSPSTDMSNDQALLNEILVDPSDDVASIDSSTDEALLHHELFVALSSYAPSVDMSSDQALVHELYTSPSTDIPSINMSNDQALVHEPFVDHSIAVPSLELSTNEALLHELFVAPSSDAPSMDMSSDQALVHEPFVDNSIDVPSIDSSTDEALLHELFVAPSSYAPSMDMSSDQALLNEILVDPSDDVPSIGCSTDEALLPKLTTTPSAVFRSIDKVTDPNIQVVEDKMQLHPPNNENVKTTKARSGEERKEAKPRERVALLPKLTTTPSAVFRSIDQFKVTDSNIQVVEDKKQLHPPNNENLKTTKARSGEERKEAKPRERVALLPKLTTTPSAVFRSIDQFKVTDSNIQVVEDKKQLHPPNNENVKTTKARSGEERKEAKPRERVALPVVIERKIKHYSSSQKILLVGEGDFSFSACLAKAFGSASNIVATSLDSTEMLLSKYSMASYNLRKLQELGCILIHEVDVRTMAEHPLLAHKVFDRIIFNFPHAGFFRREDNVVQIRLHQLVSQSFFPTARSLLTYNGEIHVTHKTGHPYSKWGIEDFAKDAGLQLRDKVPFSLWEYPGYMNKRGDGNNSNDTFHVGFSITYKFGLTY